MQKNFFAIFFFITYPQAHYLRSKKLNFLLLKFCAKILICKHYFSPLNTFVRKGKDLEPDPDPDPYLGLMDPDPNPGGPKHAGPDPVPDPQHCQKCF